MGTGAASTTTVTAPQLPYDSAANDSVIPVSGNLRNGAPGLSRVRQFRHAPPQLEHVLQRCRVLRAQRPAITAQVTRRTVIDQYGSSGLQCKHDYFYNTVGGLTEQDDYDYGSGAPGALLKKTLVTFASLSNITAFRQTVTVQNGAGATVAATSLQLRRSHSHRYFRRRATHFCDERPRQSHQYQLSRLRTDLPFSLTTTPQH